MSNKGVKVFAAGELLVTGLGEVVIDEIVPKSRALLVHPDHYVEVHFDTHECGPAPCAGDDLPDVLEWELFMRPVQQCHGHQHRHHVPEEELRLKVRWRVGSSRTVKWKIHVPV